MAKMTKAKIKASLNKQLDDMGANIDHYSDLVSDYCALWSVKEQLIKDIEKRGVVYKDFSSVGVEMQKNNPSVKELVGVNKQMLNLLKELGLTTANVRADDDDEL